VCGFYVELSHNQPKVNQINQKQQGQA